jgi:hypothetical protein
MNEIEQNHQDSEMLESNPVSPKIIASRISKFLSVADQESKFLKIERSGTQKKLLLPKISSVRSIQKLGDSEIRQ